MFGRCLASYFDQPFGTAVLVLATCPMATQLWCVILPRCQLPPSFIPEQNRNPKSWLQSSNNVLPKQLRRGWLAIS